MRPRINMSDLTYQAIMRKLGRRFAKIVIPRSPSASHVIQSEGRNLPVTFIGLSSLAEPVPSGRGDSKP
jgi:hypothetical protein